VYFKIRLYNINLTIDLNRRTKIKPIIKTKLKTTFIRVIYKIFSNITLLSALILLPINLIYLFFIISLLLILFFSLIVYNEL